MRVTKGHMPIHFMPAKGKASCGEDAYGAGATTLGSRDVRDVTCARCMGTDEFSGGALAQRRDWQVEDTHEHDGLTVPQKVAVGVVSKSMRELIEQIETHLKAEEARDQEIDDLEHALHCIPWWNIRTRQPIKTKLARLRRERGY